MPTESRIILTISHQDYLLDSSVSPIDAIKLFGKLTPVDSHYFTNHKGRHTQEWVLKPNLAKTALMVVDANFIVTKESEDVPFDKQCV